MAGKREFTQRPSGLPEAKETKKALRGNEKQRRPSAVHYILAVCLTVATLSIYLALSEPFKNQPAPIVFIIAIALSAYFGGAWPGLLATLLSVLAADYFLIPPLHTFFVVRLVDYVRLGSLAAAGVFISVMSEALHRAKERAVREILEREQAREMLAESEERYRSLFENMVDGFAFCKMIFDEQGRAEDFLYLEVNAAFTTATGLENVVGKRVTEVIPGVKEAHPEIFEIYGRVARTGKPERFEIDFKPLRAWFSVSVYSPLRAHVAVLFQNITESKKAEQTIRQSEAELTAIYNNVPLIMLLLDGENRVRKVNRFVERLLESPSESLLGQRSGDALRCLRALDHHEGCGFGPQCGDCTFREAVLETIATGRSHQQIEARLPLTVSGKTEDVVFLVSTANLKVQGQARILVTLQDITERKKAEAELEHQLHLLKCISDQAADSIFVTDREGRVTFVNPEAERVFDYTIPEFMGRNLHDMIHHHYPDGRVFPSEECPGMRTLGTGEVLRHREGVYFRKDGSEINASNSTGVLEVGGERLGIVHVIHDMTEVKEAARAKLRSQKMEALGTIAGGIAHDFNNILAAINGNARLALADLAEGRSVQECLSEINKAGERAAQLVQRILAFSRPTEQKRDIQPLESVVDEALKLVRATLPALIEIHTEYAPELPAVSVDSSQIHQVIVNLATNAAYAIGDRPGRIEVRIDKQSLCPEDLSITSKLREGRYVRLHFSDNGCGMSAAVRERIFDPFFTTKPVGQGTGLGLSVVHGIVTSHEGGLAVYSEPGKGTTFQIHLPAVERSAEHPKESGPEIRDARGERILFVDDEEALVFLGTRKLELLGYRVRGFTDPEVALREFRQTPRSFDLIIADVSMPRLSGFDFAREILALRHDIPIIMSSGYVRPEDQAKGEQLGLRELISKPWAERELGGALERALAKLAAAKPASA